MPDTHVPLDGLKKPDAQPQTIPQKSEGEVPPRRALQTAIFIAAGMYILMGIVFMALFPTTNTDIAWVGLLSVPLFGIGLLVWGGIGLIALYRIGTYASSNKKMKASALIRTGLVVVPTVSISALTLLIVNREPALSMDILFPTNAAELVAPVQVKFGTETARNVLRQKGLEPVRYSWDFEGDGVIDQVTTEPEITTTYLRSSIYLVTATADLSNGQTRTLSRRLRIPREVFSVDPSPPVRNEPVTFSLAHLFPDPEAFASAQWDFDGDGIVDATVETLTASHTYTRIAEYSPNVVIVYVNGAQTELTRTLTVTEPTPLPFPVTMNSLPPTLLSVPPFGVVFSIETDEPIESVNWSYGDGETDIGQIAEHVFDTVGNFPVTATVRSQSGSVARVTKLVRITQPLKLSDLRFTGTPQLAGGNRIEGQQPLEVNITPETSEPLVTFTWDATSASEVKSKDKTLIATFREVGTHTIELIGIDAQQRVLRKKIEVIVTPPDPIITIDIDPVAPVAPAMIHFDATKTLIPGKEITGFEWDFGDRVSKPLGAITEHLYEEPGTYQIRLRVKTIDGETYEATKSILVRQPSRDLCFFPSRDTGNAPLSVEFNSDCSTEGFTGHLWDFGDGWTSEEVKPVHVFTAPGTFTVRLTAKDSEGKSYEEETLITVRSGLEPASSSLSSSN